MKILLEPIVQLVRGAAVIEEVKMSKLLKYQISLGILEFFRLDSNNLFNVVAVEQLVEDIFLVIKKELIGANSSVG